MEAAAWVTSGASLGPGQRGGPCGRGRGFPGSRVKAGPGPWLHTFYSAGGRSRPVTAGKALPGPSFLPGGKGRHSRLTASAGSVERTASDEMPASPWAPHPSGQGPPGWQAAAPRSLQRCALGPPGLLKGSGCLDAPALQALFPLDAIPNLLQLRGAPSPA